MRSKSAAVAVDRHPVVILRCPPTEWEATRNDASTDDRTENACTYMSGMFTSLQLMLVSTRFGRTNCCGMQGKSHVQNAWQRPGFFLQHLFPSKNVVRRSHYWTICTGASFAI